jgi:dipeptidyl aminopeptidase/acylaminoacyl peptidase
VRLTHRNAAVAAVIALACLAGATAILFVARGHQERIERTALDTQLSMKSTDTVTFQGVGDVHFGDSIAALASTHGFTADPAACTRTFSDIAGVDPVMADGKLVLMWIHAPVHTPEGISEGSSVDAVRTAYAGAQELTPPSDSHAYPGILVVKGDKAFLFLHDGQKVQKEIAGYADYVRRLYAEGFGAC